MKARVPQHLHLPTQILWFDAHEFVVLVLAFTLALIVKSWAWVPIMVLAGVVIFIKRRRPRGWLLHILYRIGIVRIKGYPLPTASRFYE